MPKSLGAPQEKNKQRVYGRRQTRLSPFRSSFLQDIYPRFAPKPDLLSETQDRSAHEFLTGKPDFVHFEIGFGNGEHLRELIRSSPASHGFLAAEPYYNGMSAFLRDLVQDSPDLSALDGRLNVLMDDALLILNSLKDSSLDALYILNPDPWPKLRHHKRRIVRAETLDIYARVLKSGAMMMQTTDVKELADWMLAETLDHGAFEWTAQKMEDWTVPPSGWHATRYESKGKMQGRPMTYLIYRRK
jgi:tRNA (guanine-N7-)-methyltransferase